MDARHEFLQKEAFFFGPDVLNVGVTRRNIQGNIYSVWTMIVYVTMEFKRIFGTNLTWKPVMRFGAWI